jgi:S1-C subfamily serine protease
MCAVFASGGDASAEGPRYERRVVALRVTHQPFLEDRPWAKANPQLRNGSAVVVAGPALLTEAEMVRDATLIQVEKHGSGARVPARVLHVDQEIDLALLAVDDPGFFADLEPASIASSVPTEGVVRTLRWQNRSLEDANGRVTRVEVSRSPYGSVQHAFLVVTTDLFGGGWSEPVFLDGRLIGLTAAQSAKLASIVPAEILRRYVAEATLPEYPGFASLGIAWQPNQGSTLARYLGLRGPPRGVVIRQVPWGSSGCSVLEPGDVLLALDGHAIDSTGNYRHPRYGQIGLENLVAEGRRPGDRVRARVLRAEREQEVWIPLRRHLSTLALVPPRRDGQAPPYLVAGGLVFRELDGRYLAAFGEPWRRKAPLRLTVLFDLEGSSQAPGRRRVVILTRVLPAAYNIGYHALENLVVSEINGRPVDSIDAAAEAFEHPAGGFHRVRFVPNEQRAELVLDAASFAPESAEILAAYGIPAPLRRDLRLPPDLGPACPPAPSPARESTGAPALAALGNLETLALEGAREDHAPAVDQLRRGPDDLLLRARGVAERLHQPRTRREHEHGPGLGSPPTPRRPSSRSRTRGSRGRRARGRSRWP